uniref:Uncharacterized protein n=1 Tax=Nelumbo nucifera TaxID=4432 RepID=A0A822YK52_NELNU|nr:TPA_asm: hypothetical protein HUJ06_010540 [Nelumbo nucifera]
MAKMDLCNCSAMRLNLHIYQNPVENGEDGPLQLLRKRYCVWTSASTKAQLKMAKKKFSRRSCNCSATDFRDDSATMQNSELVPCGEEEEGIDLRAEEFIAKFYARRSSRHRSQGGELPELRKMEAPHRSQGGELPELRKTEEFYAQISGRRTGTTEENGGVLRIDLRAEN